MKKNKLKFVMSTDWIFEGVIDSELKEYVLLGYFQKLNKQLEEMKVYPMFTEITLHLANIRNLLLKGQILYTDKSLSTIDDELTITDFKVKDKPSLTENEEVELRKILKYSETKLQDYFDIIKSVWTIVYDSIEVVSITNEDNLESKKGYFYTKSNNLINIWEYNIRKNKGDIKTTFKKIEDTNYFTHLISTKNNLPTFYIHYEKEVPFEETLLPLMKRKVMSYIFQSKNLAIR
jgi:hypothetical protein